MVPAFLVQATLTTPHAIVRGLHARDAVGEELTEFFMRRHAAGRRVVQAFHVNAVVFVVFLVIEHVLRYLRDLQASIVPLMPHALHAYPGIQALILIR